MNKVISFFVSVLFMCLFITCKKTHVEPAAPSVPVTPYTDTSYPLHDSVIDAEYAKNKDLIVAVTKSDSLMIIDPVNKTTRSILLNLPATCVSVSPNGNYAIVGHNGSVSFFDLTTQTLITILPTSFNAGDIVLTNNKWAYAFPASGSGQLGNIKCINLSTGNMSLNTGSAIYGGAKGKLHPSGSFLYVLNSSLEKENITAGTADFMYADPDLNYSIFSNLWMFEDSARVLVQASNVLHTTTLQNTDMQYAGSLGPVGSSAYGYGGSTLVYTADYSKTANAVYAIDYTYLSNQPDTVVKKYTGDYLTNKGYSVLPKLFIQNAKPNKPYSSQGYFGFFNTQGTKFHVIVNANDSANTHTKWAVVSLDVQ
jgi:hypothetical protein